MDKIGPDGVAKELAEEGFDQAGIDAYMELFRNVTPDLAGIRYLGEKLSGFLDEKIAQDLVTIIESVDAVKTANFRLVFDPPLCGECPTIQDRFLRSVSTVFRVPWEEAEGTMR